MMLSHALTQMIDSAECFILHILVLRRSMCIFHWIRALIGEIMWKYPYLPNMQTSETLPLGDYLEHYVTFGPETSLGAGDHIYLYNEWNQLIGDYTGNSLAN